MKFFLTILLLVFFPKFTHGEKKNISFECCKECSFDTLDVMTAYNDFILSSDTTSYSKIILIDYKKDKDTIILSILESIDTYELFYRYPTCYFLDKKDIVYIYTSSYANSKDSVFLSKVLDNTQRQMYYNPRKQLDYRRKTGKELVFRSVSDDVVWKSDSIKRENTIISYKEVPIFDPVPVEYKIKDHCIISKRYGKRVIFPDISVPKGVGLPNRFPPYWRETPPLAEK